MTQHDKPRSRLGLLLLSAATSCTDLGGGFRDFGTELFDPEFSYLNSSRKLIDGHYSNLQMEVNNEGERFVLAMNSAGEFTIIPLDGGEPCVAGQTARYGRTFATADQEPMIPFVDEASADPELVFTDLRCQLSSVRIPNPSSLPTRQLPAAPPNDEPAIVVETQGGQLLAVDPWQDSTYDVLCEQDGLNACPRRFGFLANTGARLWTVEINEAGSFEFVSRAGPDASPNANTQNLRHAPFELLGRLSPEPGRVFFGLDFGIEEMVVEECVPPGEPLPNGQEDFCRIRLVDLAGLEQGIEAPPGDETNTLYDACFPRYVPASGGETYLAYFVGCTPDAQLQPVERQLRLMPRSSPAQITGLEDIRVLDCNANRWPNLTGSGEGLRATYVKAGAFRADDGELTTRLVSGLPSVSALESETGTSDCSAFETWLTQSPSTPETISPSALLSLTDVAVIGGGADVRTVANYDSAARAGELVFWRKPNASTEGRALEWQVTDLDGEVTDLDSLPGFAADVGGLGLLADFDGLTGTLYRVEYPSPDALNGPVLLEAFAEGVPLNGRKGNALITRFDGVTGDLTLYDPESRSLRLLARDVGRESYGFAIQFDGMIYLADRDPDDDTSTLKVRFFETDGEFELSRGVVESREVSIPGPGILYSISRPEEDAGIWFAEAR